VAKRVLWSIPVVLIVLFIVFWGVREGTDPVNAFVRLNPRATPEMIETYKEVNGLNGTIIQQFGTWLSNFLTGQWGESIVGHQPVWPEIKQALANSIVLGLFASIIGITIGLSIGILSALRQYSKFDSAATSGAFVAISFPPFVSAILLQVIFAVAITNWLGLSKPFLPTSGVYPPGQVGFDPVLRVKHMILPATVVAIQIIAVYSRYMRSSLLDTKSSDYMRTARAKGISERRVIVHHALRNAFIPIVTLVAIDIGAIVGGLIITERIFEYKGMGDFFLTALGNGDFPQLMPWVAIVVISIIAFNLFADLGYAWLDPRIRLD